MDYHVRGEEFRRHYGTLEDLPQHEMHPFEQLLALQLLQACFLLQLSSPISTRLKPYASETL